MSNPQDIPEMSRTADVRAERIAKVYAESLYAAAQKSGQLDQVLDRATPLTLFPLRITEYMSVGNGLAISRAFNVRECYATLLDALLWLIWKARRPTASSPTSRARCCAARCASIPPASADGQWSASPRRSGSSTRPGSMTR